MSEIKNQLVLRELTKDDEVAFLKGLEDWKDDDLDWYTFVWNPGMSHQDTLRF